MNRQQEISKQYFQSFYDQLGYNESQLKWGANPHNLVISGLSDFSSLSKLRNVILSLRQDFNFNNQRGINIANNDNLQKRLLLAQNEIDGLLRKKINYSVKNQNGEERQLDYSNLLNEKENQIVELQKKIQNLQEKLRRAFERQKQLQDHLIKLSEETKRKQDLITLKHNSAVAQLTVSTILRDAIYKIKKNIEINRYKVGDLEKLILQGVNFNEIGSLDIKSQLFSQNNMLSSRSRLIDQISQNQKYSIKLAQFFREFQRLSNQQQGISDFQVQRILQGFLLNMNGTKLYQKMHSSIEKYRILQDYKRISQNFAVAAGLYEQVISYLKKKNINLQEALPIQIQNIFELLRREKIIAMRAQNGAIFISSGQNAKIIEVPTQDARTKHLIHLLAHELKKMFLKYPKLQSELDERLIQFLQQEIIDVMEVDQIQKLIQIVKFVPQIVKVENIYTHSTQKQRKIQFHLRILIKALLQELEKIKLKTGLTLQLDQGVIGMINAEIMHVVNVDDILKVFRVSPKIVQVEKIIQKIVQRVVEVPKVITVDKIVEKIVEVQKIRQVQKIVYIPLQTPLVVETSRQTLVPYENRIQTIVEVPTIVQKFVQLHTEVPKIVEIQVFKDKIVEVEVPFEMEKIVNHIQTQIKQIEIISQKIVQVQKIIQKIVEVPVFVEKIVQRIIEVPKIIQIEKIVQKIVPVIEYRNARQVVNNIQIRYQIVERIVEKIVPVIQIRQKIKQVPQIIEVIKQVNNVITEIKEVQVIRQKLVIQQSIKEIERVEIKFVEVVKQVIKQVERYIQIPIIKQIAVIKEIIIEKPIISRIQSVHIKEVIVKEPLIIKQPSIIQIQKRVNVYVDVPKIVKCFEEKIVQVPTIIYKIKQVPVIVEKIIQKMVEVPKVVEVQKIVEKIIVVPRVIEKVVQVPQFVQKIIEKQVIREVIRFIEKQIQVPVIQQTIREIQVIRNVYIQKQIPVEKRVEITVEVPRLQQRIVTKEILRQVPINIIHEKPRDLEVQKIVTQVIDNIRPIEYTKQIIVPIEIPVPVEVIKEKVVPREQIIERIISVPQIVQKIVTVVHESIEIREIQKIVERILIQKRIQEVEKIVPYIQEIVKQIPTIVERIVPVQTKVEQIVIAQQIIQKVIEKIITIPHIYEVQKVRQKLVEVPKLIEIERIIPQIVKVNQYIQKIVQKIVHVPTIIQKLKEVVREQQKIVQTKHQKTQIIEVQKSVEKLVYVEKLKQVVRNVNYIQKVLQIIDRIEQIPVSIITTQEKFIEVPFILEKIVQKIIIMPQIVEVLKYVHEVIQIQDAGVCVDVQFGAHEARYKALTKKIQLQLDSLLKQLRIMKTDPNNRQRIQGIERFLDELKRFILVPRIVKVTQEKIVEKQVHVDKFIQLPVEDQRSIKMQLSLTILIEKLINQLKRIKQKTGANIQLDEDIKLIFFAEINSGVNLNNQMQTKLKNYSNYIQRQFESLGSWTLDHQLMLNSFLQQRFLMAELIQNANFQIQNAKSISDQRMEGLKSYRNESTVYSNLLNKISIIVAQDRPLSQINDVLMEYKNFKPSPLLNEKTHALNSLQFSNERIESLFRQKDAQINMLKDRLSTFYSKNQAESKNDQHQSIIKLLRKQIQNLRNQNTVLLSKTSENGLLDSFRQQIGELQKRNLELQSEISRLKSDNYNKDNEIKLMLKSVSFRKQPQAAFQQIDLRQINQRNSRLSQSSQGQSLVDSQNRQGQIGNFTSSIYLQQSGQSNIIKGSAGFQHQPISATEKFRQATGVKNNQSSSKFKQQPVNMYQSGIKKNSPYDSLYRSQKSDQNFQQIGINNNIRLQNQSNLNTLGSINQINTSSGVNQPYILPNVLGGTNQFNSLGVLNQMSTLGGANQFNNFGNASQSNTLGGTNQPNTSGANLSRIQNFGVEDSNNLKYSQGKNLYPSDFNNTGNISSASQSNLLSQTGSIPISQSQLGQSISNRGQNQIQDSLGKRSQISLSGYRGDNSRSYIPTTQAAFRQEYGYQQPSRNLIGMMSPQSLIQSRTANEGSLNKTPVESLKYYSPSPSGQKLTQSILKQEQSLSKYDAQSPQIFKKQDNSRIQYKYYYKQNQKPQQKK